MKSPVAEVRTAESTWSQKIARARELRGKSMGLLFDRTAILVDVYADPEFVDSFENMDAAIEALDLEVADTSCGFMELRSIYEMFPTRRDWLTGKLQDLRAQREVAEKERRSAARLDADTPTTTRRRATVHEVEEIKKDAAAAAERVETQSKQIERLLQENEGLKRDLLRSQGRIEELERLLSQYTAKV